MTNTLLKYTATLAVLLCVTVIALAQQPEVLPIAATTHTMPTEEEMSTTPNGGKEPLGKQRRLYLTDEILFIAEALYFNHYGWGGVGILGYRFNNYISLGAGSGYVKYSGENFNGSAVPVFTNLRVNMLHHVLSPYVSVAGGVCFDTYTNTDTYTDTYINIYYPDNIGTRTETSEHKTTYGYYNVAAGLHLQYTSKFAIHTGAGFNNIVNAFTVSMGISVIL
jgi:hypothetical protein